MDPGAVLDQDHCGGPRPPRAAPRWSPARGARCVLTGDTCVVCAHTDTHEKRCILWQRSNEMDGRLIIQCLTEGSEIWIELVSSELDSWCVNSLINDLILILGTRRYGHKQDVTHLLPG